jgi:hypothetical protein
MGHMGYAIGSGSQILPSEDLFRPTYLYADTSVPLSRFREIFPLSEWLKHLIRLF